MGDEKNAVQCPTVGRVVYYKSRGSADGKYPKLDRAAMVTQVVDADNLIIGLCVLNPTGMFFIEEVKNGQEGGMWDWMPYQKDVQKRLKEDKEAGAKPVPDPEPEEKTDEEVEKEQDEDQEIANDQAEEAEAEEKAEEVPAEEEANKEDAPAEEPAA
jgi:hypothetical protein